MKVHGPAATLMRKARSWTVAKMLFLPGRVKIIHRMNHPRDLTVRTCANRSAVNTSVKDS